LLVVTRHPGGPPGRPKVHPALPLRAILHFTWPNKTLLWSFSVQGRFIGPETRAFLGCHSFVRRVAIHRATSDCRTCWRAAGTGAFALYVVVARCGCAPKTFPKRAHKRACIRLVRNK
jgi:hypothetical protein